MEEADEAALLVLLLVLEFNEDDLLALDEVLLAELFGLLPSGAARVRTVKIGDVPESFPARSNAVIVYW